MAASPEPQTAAEETPLDETDFQPARPTHWLTRTAILRGLGLVYTVAFAILIAQLRPLIGARGLLPARELLADVATAQGGRWAGFVARPSVFWLDASDGFMLACAWVGMLGGIAVMAGTTNAGLLLLLWLLYLSFDHVGQIWYGYGWEILLLEAGFLAVFLCSWRDYKPMSLRHPPPQLVIWLYRWLAFRLMFGAGLIKMRGDACWRSLTCMQFHYETQPNPNPISWLLHHMPAAFHTVGTLFNHAVELIIPVAILAPRPYRTIAGLLLVAFQIILIISGNLSFLNWLTLVVCLSCFDDDAVVKLLRGERRERAAGWLRQRTKSATAWVGRRWLLGALGVMVAVLSIDPVVNLMSPRQRMNTSFDRLHLVNTYGAFGSIDRERFELVIQGTADEMPATAVWRDYVLPCQPGPVDRRPCLISPYHYRLDWQIWWPFNRHERPMWLYHLIYKLLSGDALVMELLDGQPFPDAPPRWIRVELYRYEFTDWGESGWWKRERVRSYLPPLSLDHPEFRELLDRRGWLSVDGH